MLADLNEVELHPVRELAESSWFSESGAAPISWNGAEFTAHLEPSDALNREWETSIRGKRLRFFLKTTKGALLVDLQSPTVWRSSRVIAGSASESSAANTLYPHQRHQPRPRLQVGCATGQSDPPLRGDPGRTRAHPRPPSTPRPAPAATTWLPRKRSPELMIAASDWHAANTEGHRSQQPCCTASHAVSACRWHACSFSLAPAVLRRSATRDSACDVLTWTFNPKVPGSRPGGPPAHCATDGHRLHAGLGLLALVARREFGLQGRRGADRSCSSPPTPGACGSKTLASSMTAPSRSR